VGPFRDAEHVAEERAREELAVRRREELELASFRRRVRRPQEGAPDHCVSGVIAGVLGLGALFLVGELSARSPVGSSHVAPPSVEPPPPTRPTIERAFPTLPLHVDPGEPSAASPRDNRAVCYLPALSGQAVGSLGSGAIHRVVMSHAGALRACYESEASRHPDLHGGVTVDFDIAAGGEVSTASIARTTLKDARVEGCVVRQLKSWHFPPSDQPTSVTGYPFRFGVGGA
jgi:hypothetical protein